MRVWRMRTGCDLRRKSKIAVGFEIAVLVFRLQWKVPLAKIAVEAGFQVEGHQLFRRGLSRGCLLQSFLLPPAKLGSGSTIPAGLSGERRSRYPTIQFYLGHK